VAAHVEVILRMYAACLEGATDADIHAIKQSMEKEPPRAPHFWILELQFPLQMQVQIASHRS
jgi:hypothetical protein